MFENQAVQCGIIREQSALGPSSKPNNVSLSALLDNEADMLKGLHSVLEQLFSRFSSVIKQEPPPSTAGPAASAMPSVGSQACRQVLNNLASIQELNYKLRLIIDLSEA